MDIENMNEEQHPTPVPGNKEANLNAEDPTAQAQSLFEDFQKLNEIYNGQLISPIKSEEGGEKWLFAGAYNMDKNGGAYMGGLDENGIFLVRGGVAAELRGFRRNNTLGQKTLENALQQTTDGNVEEFGKSELVRIIDNELMSLWENSYRTNKERIDMSNLQLPNIKKARQLVRDALSSKIVPTRTIEATPTPTPKPTSEPTPRLEPTPTHVPTKTYDAGNSEVMSIPSEPGKSPEPTMTPYPTATREQD